MRRPAFATVIVGSSPLLREGISRVLGMAGFRILASASRIEELVPSSLSQRQSLLLIIDACDGHDPVMRQIQLFKKRHPTGRIAIVADHFQICDVVAAYRAGVQGYFVKVATCEAFIKSLELIILGQTILPAEILSFILDKENAVISTEDHAQPLLHGETPHFSPQENSILLCLLGGDSNKVIARKMHISEGTVKVHVKAILRKVRARNRTQAAIWAMNHDPSLRTTGSGRADVQADDGSPNDPTHGTHEVSIAAVPHSRTTTATPQRGT
jgi:two-component system nitrate/nitrite response regulator NarL